MYDLENFRSIPPPPPEIPIRLKVNPPVRQSRARDYIKTEKRFLIELLFRRDLDLALFEQFINRSPIRIAEYKVPQQDPSRVFMIDSRLSDDSTQDDVWKWAAKELPKIQAAIAIECPPYTPATVRCLIEVFPGGKVQSMRLPLDVRIPSTDDIPAIARILHTTGDPLNPYLLKCECDKDFNEAMMYCGQALGLEGANQWANLYRTYEVVADRFGGDDGIVSKLKGCSRHELERFKRTVNHQEAIGAFSRHARFSYQPPPNPMPFDAAVPFVLGLMASWFRSGECINEDT